MFKSRVSIFLLLLLWQSRCSGSAPGSVTAQSPENGRLQPDKLEYPVWWFAPFWSTSGYGTEAISYVLSVLRSGLVRKEDVWITQHGDDPKEVVVNNMNLKDRLELQALEVAMLNTTRSPIIMCHSMPPSWGQRREDQLGPHACPPDPAIFKHAYLIGRTMFETDNLPKMFVDRCNAMHEVWVPSEFARHTFIKAGVKPSRIVILPQGIDTQHFDPELYRRARLPRGQLVFGGAGETLTLGNKIGGRDADKPPTLRMLHKKRPYRFLSIFKWEARKGWDVLLEAYLSEFTTYDSVELYIVTHPFQSNDGNFSTKMHQWAAQVLGPRLGLAPGAKFDLQTLPKIYVLQRHIADKYYPMLYKACDVLVQPTRGEGWGRPQVEAMAMGLPVISTNWSGVTAYLDDHVGYPLKFDGTVTINDTKLEWFHGHQWAQPSVSHLRTLMRHVFTNPDEGRRKGAAARRRMMEQFSPTKLAEHVVYELHRIQKIIPLLPHNTAYRSGQT